MFLIPLALASCADAPYTTASGSPLPPSPDTTPKCAGGSFDTAPEFVSGWRPNYPVFSRKRNEQGPVVVKFWVLRDGSTEIIEVATRESDALRDASIEAVKEWKFRPALKGGVPMTTACVVSFIYELM